VTIDNIGFIAAAYVVCFGALALYLASLRYRRRDGE
jgi:hypothetical protein